MKYEIIYADFPWRYTSFGTAKLPYKTMSWKEIRLFDFKPFMAKNCVLFSWATGPYLEKQIRCGAQWAKDSGLHYQGMAYVWIKTKKDGTPIGASGPRPRFVKPLTEFVLVYSTQSKKRTFPLLTEAQCQTGFWPEPVYASKVARGQHSRKPPEVRDRIVELLGKRKRIELFARERIRGWDGWGDEYPGEPKEKRGSFR
jgi:site-specific DNA-methyltransferase (adenine-specific)